MVAQTGTEGFFSFDINSNLSSDFFITTYDYIPVSEPMTAQT